MISDYETLKEYWRSGNWLNNSTPIAYRIVFKIVDDLTDRRGFDYIWDGCDTFVREELCQKWLTIVNDEIEKKKKEDDDD